MAAEAEKEPQLDEELIAALENLPRKEGVIVGRTLRGLLAGLDRIRDEPDEIHVPYEELTDERREDIRDRLEAQADSELVGLLLALHKQIQLTARGRLGSWVEIESIMLTTVLNRFATVPFYDALAVWEENQGEDDDDELTVDKIIGAPR